MSDADALAAERGVRLTPTRRRVLEIVAEHHRPLGAYEILERLSRERGPVAPPTVYRALAFLVENGFAHRIESLNAFVACFEPAHRQRAFFLICERCGDAAELLDAGVERALDAAAAARGFTPARLGVEIAGVCGACAAAQGS